MKRHLLVPAATIIVSSVALFGTVRCHGAGLEAAEAEAKRTGKPLLVIGTSDACSPCKRLKSRLANEPELKALMAEYVSLELSYGSPEFRSWISRFRPKGRGIPMIFIVSSDGREIYNGSGVPRGDGLKRVLMMGVEQAGVSKDTQPEAFPDELIAPTQRASSELARKQPVRAVQTIKPYLDRIEQAAVSEHPAAKSFVELVDRLTELGRADLEAAERKLSAKGKAYYGLLALVKTNRTYGDLPALRDDITQRLNGFRNDLQKGKLVAQAEWIDRGRAHEDHGNRQEAAHIYREVISTYPDTLAAKLCQTRIEELGGERVATRPDASAGSTSPTDRRRGRRRTIRAWGQPSRE